MTISAIFNSAKHLYDDVWNSSLRTQEKVEVFSCLERSLTICWHSFRTKLRVKTTAGKGIEKLIETCRDEKRRAASVRKVASEIIKRNLKVNCLEVSSSVWKSFCYNTLNRASLKFENLGGERSHVSMTHILHHLETFQAECEADLSPFLSELRFARDLAALTSAFTTFQAELKKEDSWAALGDDSRQHGILNETAERVLDRLQELIKSKFNQGRSVLFVQAGYCLPEESHAIGFEVGRDEESQALYLKVLNGGDGMGHHGKGPASKVYEKIYKGCTPEQLGVEFWRGLYLFRLTERKQWRNGARSVYSYLNRMLPLNQKVNGRAYAKQILPSCSAKTTMIWLRGRLGPKLGSSFRWSMTQSQLGAVEKLANDLENLSLLDSFQLKSNGSEIKEKTLKANALIEEGWRVARKREVKAKRLNGMLSIGSLL